MKFLVEGKEIELADSLLLAAGVHAEERGMTLEDYIAEAFTMLKEDKESGWDANGSPVED